MNKFDKGSVIRTIVLAIALLNQLLVANGLYKIPGTADEQTNVLSFIFTAAASIWSWFKNNYVTSKGHLQKKALQAQGLIKK